MGWLARTLWKSWTLADDGEEEGVIGEHEGVLYTEMGVAGISDERSTQQL